MGGAASRSSLLDVTCTSPAFVQALYGPRRASQQNIFQQMTVKNWGHILRSKEENIYTFARL